MKLLKLKLFVFKLLDIMKMKIHFKMETIGVDITVRILDVWCFTFMLLTLVDLLKVLLQTMKSNIKLFILNYIKRLEEMGHPEM